MRPNEKLSVIIFLEDCFDYFNSMYVLHISAMKTSETQTHGHVPGLVRGPVVLVLHPN